MELKESPRSGLNIGDDNSDIRDTSSQKESSPVSDSRGSFMREDLIARMRRIEGQARGIQKMLEDKRNCDEIIVQLSAMKAGIDQVAIGILGHYLARCIDEERARGKDTQAALEKFMPVFRQFI